MSKLTLSKLIQSNEHFCRLPLHSQNRCRIIQSRNRRIDERILVILVNIPHENSTQIFRFYELGFRGKRARVVVAHPRGTLVAVVGLRGGVPDYCCSFAGEGLYFKVRQVTFLKKKKEKKLLKKTVLKIQKVVPGD